MPEEERPERHYPARPPWKRIHNRTIIVFLTVCSKNRRPIFAKEDIAASVVDAWKSAHAWMVGRYVILPDHIHLFASPNSHEAPDVRTWVRFWKSYVSRHLPDRIEGGIWQRDVWDRQLRSQDSYRSKWEYVRNNPVRHGLVKNAEDWPYQGELNVLPWHD